MPHFSYLPFRRRSFSFPRRLALLLIAASAPHTHAADPRGDALTAPLLPAAQSKALFKLPPGFEIQLVADESEIQKPFNLAFDSFGRVWVTGSSLYPWPARRDALGQPIPTFDKHWTENGIAFRAASAPPEPVEHGTDTVRILSDFDPVTGRAREVTTFADGLNIPIGLLPLPRAPGAKGDTLLVYSIPAIWRLTDTDGDGRADLRDKLYDGFGFRDTHGMSSSYWLWLDGWVYGTHGFANPSEVTDRAGRTVKLASGNTYRFRPDGSRFELVTHGQTNPYGLAFDARGELYTADSHSKPVYLLIPGGYYEGISKEHDGLGFAPAITTDDHGSSAIAGIAHYSANHFPPEFQNNLFNGNPVTRRINRDRLDWRGSSTFAARQPDFLTSDDPSFRPVQVKLGPDGALWIADFYNPIIGHYEVPLTHPSRDRSHGRIWRIVWRGLDGAGAPPSLPNLATLSTANLVAPLSDSNNVVRSLAVAELFARPDAASTAPALLAAATRLVAGTDPTADETAALPLLLTLERLDRTDDALLRRALTRPASDVALAALRVLTLRTDAQSGMGVPHMSSTPSTPSNSQALTLNSQLATLTPEFSTSTLAWRLIAQLIARDPQPWTAPIILALQARTTDSDPQLLYALRLALKARVALAPLDELNRLAAEPAAAERLADVAVAVPTPAVAEFLLAYLERTQFASPRAGEFARHAVRQLPADRLAAIEPVMNSIATAPAAQQLAFAEGLASVSRLADRTLPPVVITWMQRTLVTTIGLTDPALARRAADAVRDLSFPEKNRSLLTLLLDAKTAGALRTSALRALTVDAESVPALITVLGRPTDPVALRRAAADQLALPAAGAPGRAALVAALPTAQNDFALGLAMALTRTDEGAAALIDTVTAGRAPAALLRHRYIADALAKRPDALRARAAALVKNLPSEDARLDALIFARTAAFAAAKPDAARGATLFAQNCAACHRVKDIGGNLGPSLDGIGSRTIQRTIEDILDPSRNIDPNFRLSTVTLKNGETKSGVNLRPEGPATLLRDPATNEEISIPTADIQSTAASPVSPMPAAYDTLLSESDFFDVITYLRATP
jgi:putative heme-binding domain-containing protein